MSRPLVTVLLPVHDGADHLRASLASVLAQSFRDFELLAIDDASTDETAAILAGVADGRLRILRNERNLGLTATLNRGIGEALGAYIARQDADDLSDPGRLEAQVRRLEDEPGLALLGCSYRRIDEDGREEGLRPAPTTVTAIRWRLLFLSAFAHSSVMIRASTLADVGSYDERFAYAQDYELWSRIARTHAVSALPEPLVSYRRSGSSLTATFAGAATEIDAISAANVDRVLNASGADRAAIAGFDRDAAWRLLFAGPDGVDPEAARHTTPAILALQAAFAAAYGLDRRAARRHRAATARRLARGLGRLAVRERDLQAARAGLKTWVSSRRGPPASRDS